MNDETHWNWGLWLVVIVSAALLAADLKNVIQETLQPANVKVWLVDSASQGKAAGAQWGKDK